MVAMSPCSEGQEDEVPEWIRQGGVILVIIGLAQSFLGLAHICDFYFCRSLEILCEENRIRDDVAGATIMAWATSCPDLLISMMSLFVFDSTIGLGTIIGSVIFNHMVVVAAIVMSSKVITR